MISTPATDTAEGARQAAPHVPPAALGFTVMRIAEALAEDGFPAALAHNFVRNMTASGHVTPYTRTRADGRGDKLYRADAVLTFAVLHRAGQAGFKGEALAALSAALLKWPVEMPDDQPRSPAALSLILWGSGERNFGVDLGIYRQPGQRQPVFGARVRQEATETTRQTPFPDAVEGLELLSSWTCLVDPLLAHLSRPAMRNN